MPTSPFFDLGFIVALIAVGVAAWTVRGRRADRHERSMQASRMRHAIEQSPHTAVLLDADLRILAINRAHLDRFGYREEQVVGHNYAEFVPQMPMSPREAAAQIFARGSVHFVRDLPLADGTPVPMEHTAIDMGDGTILAIGRELTADQETSRVLQNAQEMMALSMEMSAIGPWSYDMATQTLWWSPELHRLYGVEPSVKATIEGFIALLHPEDRQRASANLRALINGNTSMPIEQPYRIVRPDTTVRWFRDVARVETGPDGRVIAIRGVGQDITEQQEAAAALRSSQELFELAERMAHVGWWRLDPTSRELYASPELWRILGSEPQTASVPPKRLLDAVHPDDRARVLEMELARQRGQIVEIGAYRIVRPDGAVRWVEQRARMEGGANGSARLFGIMRDITEQHEAELRLRANRDLLTHAESIAHVGSWEYDARTDTVSWSDEAYRIHGWDPATTTLTGQMITRATHPDDRERMRLALRNRTDPDVQTSEPYRIVRPDGTVRWVEQHRRAERDATGSLVRVYGTVRDITEQHEADVALRASHDRLELAERVARVGSSQHDLHGGPLIWSNEGMRIHGWDPATTVPTPRMLLELVHPDDRERVRAMLIARAVGDLTPIEPYRIIRADDGRTRWMEERAEARRDAHGQIIDVINTVRDITEQHEAELALRAQEMQLRTVLDSTQSAVMLWTADNRLLYANEQLLSLLGYTFDELSAFAGPLALLHPGERTPRTDARVVNATSGQASPPMMRRLVRKDGSVISLRSVVTPYPMPDGSNGVLVDAVDLSTELALQEQLNSAQKMEAVGRLVAGVAHDFNNLLTVIHGSLELLARLHGESTWLTNARTAAERAADLVRQLLQFSRASTGERVVIDLDAFVRDVISMMRATVDRRIALNVDTRSATAQVLADRTQLQQVLMNLLVNARDAVTERIEQASVDSGYEPAITVSVDSARDAEGAQWVTLSVADNGAGIPPEAQARIFEPFFSTKEVGRGTGLGLATVYGIVNGHGGTITFDTTPGEGTRFTITLPDAATSSIEGGDAHTDAAATAHSAADDTPPTSTIQPGADAPVGADVLLVDDEEALRLIAGEALRISGHRVTTASDGEEAVALIRERPFDLVIMDINMPRMDGWSALERMLALRPEQRVLMASGFANEAEALARGAIGLIPKPYDLGALAEAASRSVAPR